MKKYIFTYHLKGLLFNKLQYMLVVDGHNESEARVKVISFFIDTNSSFSYHYVKAKTFKEKYGMVEITFDELQKLHDKKVENTSGDIIDASGFALMTNSEEDKNKAKEDYINWFRR